MAPFYLTSEFVALLATLAIVLYVQLGRAFWTLMFVTDPDKTCPLRAMAFSGTGVPRLVYWSFLAIWPIMLFGTRLLMGRNAPVQAAH